MLGAALIDDCLQYGTNVFAVVRPNSKNISRLPKSELLHVIECELSGLKGLKFYGLPEEIDAFYHFGWEATTKSGRNSPSQQSENISSSLEAVRLAHSLGCRKFIGAGSQAEYGIHTNPVTSPNTHAEPVTAYGISKLAAGRLCALEAEKLRTNFVWVRIFSVYGDNDGAETMITAILRKLMKNEYCALTQGVQNWDYLYSSDAGRAFRLIGESDTGKSSLYCLGSGKARSIRSYVEDMKEAAESSSVLGFGDVPYTDGIPPSMCADISDLTRDTGFVPEVSFMEGIQKIINITYRGGGYEVRLLKVSTAFILSALPFEGEENKNAA